MIAHCRPADGQIRRSRCRYRGQADEGIVAQWSHRTERVLLRPIHCPSVIPPKYRFADPASDRALCREDADDLGPPLDLAFESLQRIGAAQLGAMPGGKLMQASVSLPGFSHEHDDLRILALS